MPAKLTLHPVQRVSRAIMIRDGESLVVGRDPFCGVIVEDSRVSKRHAELRWSNGAWTLEDLDSKNGTTVNGQPARGGEVRNGDWISFGGLMARFERLSAAQAATHDSERLARIQASGEMQRRLNADLEPGDLLLRFLESAMELTRTERGFVLVVAPDGKVRAEVAAGLSPETLRDERFRGSVGAVRQALETGGPVMLADVRADPGLGKRPSVVAFGIRSLACVPLRHEDKVLGVIYVDSRKLGPAFTDLDLEILERMADHMGVILAPSLADGSRPLRSSATQASLVAQLQQRIEELLPAS
jgi:GAF domain-containing protein/FHA domain-containing protein